MFSNLLPGGRILMLWESQAYGDHMPNITLCDLPRTSLSDDCGIKMHQADMAIADYWLGVQILAFLCHELDEALHELFRITLPWYRLLRGSWTTGHLGV